MKSLRCCLDLDITEISNIEGLKELHCSWSCQSLTKIPNIPGLKKLFCHGCPNLTEIANIDGLKELYCGHCPNLTEISNMKDLQILRCGYCRNLIKIPHCQGYSWVSNCPWLNPDFENNLKKLVKIQKWVKRWVLRGRKLKRMIPSISEIYYHPDCKGGYSSQLEFVTTEGKLLNC